MNGWGEAIYVLSMIIVMQMAYKGLQTRMREVEEKWKFWAGLRPGDESTLQGEALKGRINEANKANKAMYKYERGYPVWAFSLWMLFLATFSVYTIFFLAGIE